ncbi:MAG: ABC transporter substrate-binding protein [bacterium]|nr:ABC transporter substrate-binding protein [bacterium]
MRILLLISVLAVSLLSAGAPARGQTAALRMAISRDEGSLNPYTYQSGYPGWNLMTLVYEPLFTPDADNIPQPWLVRRYSVSPDGRTWTLTLHPNIKWHDGRPLTADDVKFTYEYVRKHAHSRWTSQVRLIESIETSGTTMLTIRLTAQSGGFLMQPLADLPILPRHIWEGVAEPRRFNDSIGSGPYKLAEMRDGQFYRLVANDAYFGGRPKVREIVLPIIRDATVTFTALKAGEIDTTARALSPELVGAFEKAGGLKVVRGAGYASTILQLNLEHPILRDVKLRQAIANAINTRLMVRLLLLGYGVVGSPGYIHPDSPFHNPAVTFAASKSRAVQILNEAGYIDRDRDGIRDTPDGRPLRFNLLTLAGNPIRVRGADLMRTWLRDIGIDVRVVAQEDASIIAQVWPDFDVCNGRNFDMAIFGWSAPVMNRATSLRDLFHSDCRFGTINIGGYKSAEVDRLGNELAAAVEPAKQKQILFEMQKTISADLPVHVLFYMDGIYAYRPDKHDAWVYQKGQGIVNKLSFIGPPKR